MIFTALAWLLMQDAPSSRCEQQITVPAGLEIPLETVTPLSSKHSAKGDMVEMRTAEDVLIDGKLVIPGKSPATGQIAESQQRGGVGVSGRLALRPLYVRVGSAIIRLAGQSTKQAHISGGAVVGIAVLSTGFVLSGRTASIPAGTRLIAVADRTTRVRIQASPDGGC